VSPSAATLRRLATLAAAGSALAVAPPALALDSFFVGARGQGMAGAVTAATDDRKVEVRIPGGDPWWAGYPGAWLVAILAALAVAGFLLRRR